MNLKRWIPFILWLLLVAGVTLSVDGGKLKGFTDWVNSLPLGDKVCHFFMIGMLALLFNYALAGRMVTLGCRQLLVGGLIVAVAVTIEEFSQIWIPRRTFDLVDLAANYGGILCARLITLRLPQLPPLA